MFIFIWISSAKGPFSLLAIFLKHYMSFCFVLFCIVLLKTPVIYTYYKYLIPFFGFLFCTVINTFWARILNFNSRKLIGFISNMYVCNQPGILKHEYAVNTSSCFEDITLPLVCNGIFSLNLEMKCVWVYFCILHFIHWSIPSTLSPINHSNLHTVYLYSW